MNENEKILSFGTIDVIPIYENERFPNRDMIFHVELKTIYNDEKIIDLSRQNEIKENMKKMVFEKMKAKFYDADVVIFVKDGIVLKAEKIDKKETNKDMKGWNEDEHTV